MLRIFHFGVVKSWIGASFLYSLWLVSLTHATSHASTFLVGKKQQQKRNLIITSQLLHNDCSWLKKSLQLLSQQKLYKFTSGFLSL